MGAATRKPWKANLFTVRINDDGEDSMIFHLDYDTSNSNDLIYQRILSRGGYVIDDYLEDAYTIIIGSKDSENFVTFLKNYDRFDEQFILDSFEDQKLKDLNQYLIGTSQFRPYDANRILHRRLKWSDLRKTEVSSIPAGLLRKPNEKEMEISFENRDAENSMLSDKGKTATLSKSHYDHKENRSSSGSLLENYASKVTGSGKGVLSTSPLKSLEKSGRDRLVEKSPQSSVNSHRTLKSTLTEAKINNFISTTPLKPGETSNSSREKMTNENSSPPNSGTPIRGVRRKFPDKASYVSSDEATSDFQDRPGKTAKVKERAVLMERPELQVGLKMSNNQKEKSTTEEKASKSFTPQDGEKPSSSKSATVGTIGAKNDTLSLGRLMVACNAIPLPKPKRIRTETPNESPPGSPVSDFSSEEDNLNVPANSGGTEQHSTKQKRKRLEYTDADRMVILNYIAENNFYEYTRGNKIWMFLERLNLLPGRTHQSLKEHYRKQIQPKIKSFKLDEHVLKKFLKAKKFLDSNKRVADAPICLEKMTILKK